MPSPINTPTGERLPSQQWDVNDESRDSGKSTLNVSQHFRLPLSVHSHSFNMHDNDTEDKQLNQAFANNGERNSQMQSTQIDGHSGGNGTECIPCSVRPSRSGLNLDLSFVNSKAQTHKKWCHNDNYGINSHTVIPEPIDISIILENQGWFHGSITRFDAENLLRSLKEGSYLIRNCECSKEDYSLSLKSSKGFMHIKIAKQRDGRYILGSFSRPFNTVPQIVHHYSINRLPIHGVEPLILLYPVIDQLL